MAEKSGTAPRDLLSARVLDSVRTAENKNCPSFVGFLSCEESSAVRQYLASADFAEKAGKSVKYAFFGGFDGAERLIFAALPAWADCAEDIAFPIAVARVTHRREFSLSHRDYLGALMSLGIERSRVGDILADEDGAWIMLHESVADYCLSELTKIGRVGVSCRREAPDAIDFQPQYEDIRLTVASERIDCIVAALAGCGRERACEMILAKTVFIGGTAVTSRSKQVKEGDTLTLRRFGKFTIDGLCDRTKKGRLILTARKRK